MNIDSQGWVQDPRVRLAISPNIERGPMTLVRGIVVHQTDSPTATSTLHSYRSPGANGAHFLIDRDGTIYQTASIRKVTWHVGPLKARCLAEHRCAPTELQALKKFDPRGEHRREMAKAHPDRYPSNQDAIGIELVGQALPVDALKDDDKTFEPVTSAQKASLKWLVSGLCRSLGVTMAEVFRHPVVSRKNRTEAETAVWQ
ncbi:peptidoglycan recognition protein family protein [Caldimonas manganoxidans]|uniref:peptidoglycan recognition protein family protein n=1 Tax=Caldimonas manganoxidans TaxID=196015 RepID=UPI0003619B36|nr:peptidoglycan recognition family protein [Caldimonas manganoxidans]